MPLVPACSTVALGEDCLVLIVDTSDWPAARARRHAKEPRARPDQARGLRGTKAAAAHEPTHISASAADQGHAEFWAIVAAGKREGLIVSRVARVAAISHRHDVATANPGGEQLADGFLCSLFATYGLLRTR